MRSKLLIMFQFLNTWLSFDNSRRLLLGFDSPIEAGILLAVIIVWVRFTAWPLSSFLKRGVVIASVVCEIALLYLLSWTGSRGPMIGLGAACFLGAGLCFREKRHALGKLLLLRSLVMMMLLVAFVGMNGFGGRFASAVASTDASVLNRWEIIKNARGLLLLDPVGGCGWGWAGYHYSHWFEPQHLRHLYTGLTNEYLQIGVEIGLPAFFLMLAGAGAILAAPWVAAKGSSLFPMAHQAGGLKDFSRWLRSRKRPTPPENMNKNTAPQRGARHEISGHLASRRDAVLFDDSYRWCRSPSLAQPPANVCQASGLKGWQRDISHKAYLSCVALAIVGCMTTFHNSPTLVAITIAMFGASCLLSGAWLNRRALLIGFVVGGLGVVALLCIPPHKQALDVSLRGGQFIELRMVDNASGIPPGCAITPSHTGGVGCCATSTTGYNLASLRLASSCQLAPPVACSFALVLVDKNVLGHVYGQSLRLLLPDKPFDGKMLVALPSAGAFRACPKGVDTCVAFGASINSDACSMLPPLERLVVVHPAMPPPERLPKAGRTIVMLPMIDEAGVNAQWERFCKAHSIPCIKTAGTGLDMQSRIGGFFEDVF